MIEWNKVIYADCMNDVNGLPTLEDKSIDLCITDPPFNIKYSAAFTKFRYEDNNDNYEGWCKSWFKELLRICETVIIHCGIQNEDMWVDIKKPLGKAYLLKKNSKSGGKISRLNNIYPLIFYGKLKKRIKKDYFEYFSFNGFLRKISPHPNLIHPCPINSYFLYDIIYQLEPKSVIDPFLGSGTTAEVCTKLGIKWLGYELNEVYSQDINKRLKNCKREPKQMMF